MVDDIRSHRIAQHARFFQSQCCCGQAARDFTCLARLVGVALKFVFQFQLAFDAGDAGGNLRGDRQIRVQVAATDAAFDTYVARTIANHAIAGSSIVE